MKRRKFIEFINNKLKESGESAKYEAYKVERYYLAIFRCEICKRTFRRDLAIIVYVRRKGTLWSEKHGYYFLPRVFRKLINGEIT